MRSSARPLHGWTIAAALAAAGCGESPAQPGSTASTLGAIWITVATVGADLDPDGYQIQIDGGAVRAVLVNQGLAWDGPAGDHTVTLSGIASNCTVTNGDTRTVRVVAGTRGAQGAAAAFQISCARVEKLAFTRVIEDFYYGRTFQLGVIYADGSQVTVHDFGDGPSWAPDGSRLVFRRAFCFISCAGQGLFLMDPRGPLGTATQLTSDPGDRDPDWAPNGRVIAFARDGALYRINADGTGDAALYRPPQGVAAAEPDWSPDGARLAFSCELTPGNRDICLVSSDGTGFQRLTDGLETESQPAWRPDGGAIAFTTSRFTPTLDVAVMNSDGTGITRLAAGREAAWSRDGATLAYVEHSCTHTGICTPSGLIIANADGTNPRRIIEGTHREPAWRP